VKDRITVDDLAWEIAQQISDATDAPWKTGDEVDAMDRTIAALLDKLGWDGQEPGGQRTVRPGVRPHILKMLEKGEITVRSTLNGMPPVDLSQVLASPTCWYMTSQDADKVRAALFGSSALRTPTREQAITHKIKDRAPVPPEVPANSVTSAPPTQPAQPSTTAEETASTAGEVLASTRPENAATPAERRAQLDMTRERGARRRILEKWNDIEKEYGKNIDARNVHRVLKRDKGEDDVVLKTVQNHLSALRKEGLIP